MTVVSMIVARWLAVHGTPTRDAVPMSDALVAFCHEQFQQVPSQNVAVNARLALVALAQQENQ